MQFWIVGICAIFLLASVSADMDADITMVRSGALLDTNYLIFSDAFVTPNFGATRDVNIIIDFNIWMTSVYDGNSVLLDINYSTAQAEHSVVDGNAVVITNDLNLSRDANNSLATMTDSNVWCSSQDWVTGVVLCHYYWNIAGIADGNYYIKLRVDTNNSTDYNSLRADYNSSGVTIRIDNSAPVYGIDFNRNLSYNIDVNGYTDKNITAAYSGVLTGVTAPSRDMFIGIDSNVRISLILNPLEDANFTPITDVNIIISDFNVGNMYRLASDANLDIVLNQGTSVLRASWTDNNFAMTQSGDFNYTFDFNVGTFWDVNFSQVRPTFILKDSAGNITIVNSAAANSAYTYVMFDLNYPATFDAIDANTTNIQDINNFAAIKRLQFSKNAFGSVTFNSTVGIDLSAPSTAAKLVDLNSYLTMTSDPLGTGNVRIALDSVNFSDLNAHDLNTDLNFFNLPLYDATPGIRMTQNSGTDVNCGYVCSTYSYEAADGTGDMNVKVAHFTAFEPDMNVPTTSLAFPSGTVMGSPTTIGLTTNEQATCRYSSTDQAYDDMASSTTTSQSTFHNWSVITDNLSTTYTFYVRCEDATDHNMTTSTAITFTTSGGGTSSTPPSTSPSSTPPVTPPSTPPVGSEETISIGVTAVGETATVNFSNTSEHAILGIALVAQATIGSAASISVKTTTQPSGVPAPISSDEGLTYTFTDISLENLTSDTLESAVISFSITKEWLEYNNIILGSVKLKRLVNGIWETLSTTHTGSDADNEFFEATTTGFSVFAVTAKAAAITPPVIPPAIVCGNGVCDTGESSANCPSDCGALTPPPTTGVGSALTPPAADSTPIIIIVVVIIVIVALVGLSRRKKA
ncbi:PGF-pre-PGF domain-containing protein [Candidatus Micrarchaeota archaeon]|nr:PGF-pre-PGF domain-containing protein [Candidatus Micrarchaeota archaeon]MBU1930402.1 PGF-pre-PGF domain-containing protein [Candidatus Micrarchaeota archaeon]